jgi:aspartate/methionine/tyrosine aminotransferase
MEVGQPGTGAPAGAIAAAMAALRSGDALGYTEAFGRRSLRERIAAHYRDWYDLDVPLERIAVTVGASGGFPLAFLAAFDPGDRVVLTSPYYPPYVNILTALGMQPVVLEAGPDTRFQPSLASPSNPAGTMLHPDELTAIATWCNDAGVRLISDEIYHGLNYESPIASAASVSQTAVVVNSFSKPLPATPLISAAALSPSAVVVNSFSKYFAMTGWRIGWLILPDDLVRPVERLAQNLFISAPHISQIAAEAAFDCHDELQTNVARYRRSRDLLLRALPGAGFTRLAPAEGAFYLFADITERSNDSAAFCARMLAEVGIAVTPGVDFDHARGNRFLRFSYCGPEADMREAATRLKAWR